MLSAIFKKLMSGTYMNFKGKYVTHSTLEDVHVTLLKAPPDYT